jgi:hypothetical protein
MGGMVSRATRIARYVVPQIRQTAIHATYASLGGADDPTTDPF